MEVKEEVKRKKGERGKQRKVIIRIKTEKAEDPK